MRIRLIKFFCQNRVIQGYLVITALLSLLLLQSGCVAKTEQGKLVAFSQSVPGLDPSSGMVHSSIKVEIADGSEVEAWLPDDQKIWDEMSDLVESRRLEGLSGGEKIVQIKYNRAKKYWEFDKNLTTAIEYFTASERSIALLPFANLNNDPEQEYFITGLHSELIASLGKIGHLKVISRTSSMQYKDSQLPIKEIGRELGVSAILEGSVRTSDNRVQVAVQLFHVRLDLHLWSEMYDLPDSPTVWSDIVQKITDEIKVYFIPE